MTPFFLSRPDCRNLFSWITPVKTMTRRIGSRQRAGACSWPRAATTRRRPTRRWPPSALRYWYPLYAFVRRKGHDAEDAQDLVQGFFACLLEKGDLALVDRSKGKFRSFLMAACTHYLANAVRP